MMVMVMVAVVNVALVVVVVVGVTFHKRKHLCWCCNGALMLLCNVNTVVPARGVPHTKARSAFVQEGGEVPCVPTFRGCRPTGC